MKNSKNLQRFRILFASVAVAALAVIAQGANEAQARDASGKGSPVYGAGHDTPHGVQPGQGVSGKPADHGSSGTSHVPGPKGGHDSESHDHTDSEHDHDSGETHVPGPKGGHEEEKEGSSGN